MVDDESRSCWTSSEQPSFQILMTQGHTSQPPLPSSSCCSRWWWWSCWCLSSWTARSKELLGSNRFIFWTKKKKLLSCRSNTFHSQGFGFRWPLSEKDNHDVDWTKWPCVCYKVSPPWEAVEECQGQQHRLCPPKSEIVPSWGKMNFCLCCQTHLLCT